MQTTTNSIEIKPYSTKELAGIYGVCDKTLKKWLLPFGEAIGNKQGRYFNVAQVKTIFDKLGVPSCLSEVA